MLIFIICILLLFLATDVAYIAYNIALTVFGILEIPLSKNIWLIVIGLHFIPGVAWAMSMYALSKLGKTRETAQ